MKHTFHPFAVALWVAAIVILIGEVSVCLKMADVAQELEGTEGHLRAFAFGLNAIWASIRSGAIGAGQLAGMGFLIEIVSRTRSEFLASKSN